MLAIRKYNEAQKARRAENLRRWRAQNRERYRQSTRTWGARDGNAERMKQWRREWLARNRGSDYHGRYDVGKVSRRRNRH